ncbi:MAG: hypothetical protein AAF678_09760 [Pseudomonadota bacterium]
MPAVQRMDAMIIGTIFIVFIATVVVYLVDKDFFAHSYAAEDGIVEYATAIFLLVCSLVLASHARSLFTSKRGLAAVCTVLYALLFFFAAGEEVSWGQRIFGWESGEFFVERNYQAETNIHNLIVGEQQLTKTLFGPILTVIMLLYLVFLPLLYPRVGFIQSLVRVFAIPVPGVRHCVLALAATLLVTVITAGRKWEVYELVFSLLMLSIFLFPQNEQDTR